MDQKQAKPPQGYRHPSGANLFRKRTLHSEPFIMNALQPKSKSKSFLKKTLPNLGKEGSAALERQHHPKHVPLKRVVAAELGSELGLIPLKPLPGHGRSRDRAVRIRR